MNFVKANEGEKVSHGSMFIEGLLFAEEVNRNCVMALGQNWIGMRSLLKLQPLFNLNLNLELLQNFFNPALVDDI